MSRRHLTREEMIRAVGMLEAGLPQREVAAALNSHASVICRLWVRYRLTGDVAERHRGRYRVTTERQDRFLQNVARRQPTITARQLVEDLQSQHQVAISDQTARRRLHEANLRARRPLRVPALRHGNRGRRLLWAREHLQWTVDQWAHVLFSDESRFGFHPDSRRVRVWRIPGRQSRLQNPQEVHPYQGGTIMVWAGIRLGGRTDLVLIRGNLNAERYCEQVVQSVVIPHRQNLGADFIFMQDNARPHTASQVMDVFREYNIEVLEWPAQSADLNPIEHAWDLLKRRAFRNLPQNLNTADELFSHLSREWSLLPQETIDSLIISMPRRCQAVVNALGGPTNY